MRVQIAQKHGYIGKDGTEYKYGSTPDLPDALAVKLLNYGIAGPAPKPEVKTAVAAAPKENAALRTSKPKPKASKSRAAKGGDD